MVVAAPKQLRAFSNTGKPKAAYIFKMLAIKGFEPFRISDAAYHQERIRHDDGTWTDVRLTTDLRGVPITRQVVNGELQDVTWWHGRVQDGACLGCTLADGKTRLIVRTMRAARKRQNGRVPVLLAAGVWHIECLKLKLKEHGRNGHDTRQTATRVVVSKGE
jgi:hypothetical protein